MSYTCIRLNNLADTISATGINEITVKKFAIVKIRQLLWTVGDIKRIKPFGQPMYDIIKPYKWSWNYIHLEVGCITVSIKCISFGFWNNLKDYIKNIIKFNTKFGILQFKDLAFRILYLIVICTIIIMCRWV